MAWAAAGDTASTTGLDATDTAAADCWDATEEVQYDESGSQAAAPLPAIWAAACAESCGVMARLQAVPDCTLSAQTCCTAGAISAATVNRNAPPANAHVAEVPCCAATAAAGDPAEDGAAEGAPGAAAAAELCSAPAGDTHAVGSTPWAMLAGTVEASSVERSGSISSTPAVTAKARVTTMPITALVRLPPTTGYERCLP